MRLWSLHPKYLDRTGLLACWREGLLAKKVLEGNTIGYKNHPQLIRFKNYQNAIIAVNAFLSQIFLESKNRLYSFGFHKIDFIVTEGIIDVTIGQLEFEKMHLLKKLQIRDIQKAEFLNKVELIEPNPIFRIIPGIIEKWEIL